MAMIRSLVDIICMRMAEDQMDGEIGETKASSLTRRFFPSSFFRRNL